MLNPPLTCLCLSFSSQCFFSAVPERKLYKGTKWEIQARVAPDTRVLGFSFFHQIIFRGQNPQPSTRGPDYKPRRLEVGSPVLGRGSSFSEFGPLLFATLVGVANVRSCTSISICQKNHLMRASKLFARIESFPSIGVPMTSFFSCEI